MDLETLARAVADGKPAPELDAVRGNPEGTAEERLTALFADALRRKRDKIAADDGNLYDQGFGPAEMLAAFDVLVNVTPFVRFGYAAANAALLRAAGNEVEIVDFGVGKGSQWIGLLPRLAGRSVKLIGIDLPASAEDPLRDLNATGELLAREAEKADVRFTWQPIGSSFESLPLLEVKSPLVNACLALHHVPTGNGVTEVDRDAYLARIRGMAPRLVTLVEPEADHAQDDFLGRFRCAWHHYGLLFGSLERLCGPEMPGRAVVERAFFGREIYNILASDGPARIERHEPYVKWRERMQRAGFVEEDLSTLGESVVREIGIADPFEVTVQGGALTLCVSGTELLTTSAWRPSTN
ncbi:MAG: GRAS family protein [Armatimonadetes bacterium]|nr:GRAS family protein [Armatimonadota bacterium]